MSISLTKVAGRHTYKIGLLQTHSYKAEQATDTNSFGTINFQQDAVGTNPFDTSFGFANAAIGTFSSYQQASKYVEGNYVYDNVEVLHPGQLEGEQQADARLRRAARAPDAAVRQLGQGTNFLPDEWAQSAAPQLYKPGLHDHGGAWDGVPDGQPAGAESRSPAQFLGPNTTTGVRDAGARHPAARPTACSPGGDGIVDTTYTFPALGVAPRFGMAYRHDRQPEGRAARRHGVVLRPAVRQLGHLRWPAIRRRRRLVTARFSQLQNLGSGGLTTQGPPGLNTIQYDPRLPSSTQWNAGVQLLLPWAMTVDVEYVGQHSFNTVRTVNLNAVDLGAAFLPQNQDTTLATSATPGATAYQTDLLRSVPRLRGDQPPHVRRLADVSLDPVLVQPPVPERPVVQLQRHHWAVRPAERRRAPPACG